MIIVGVCLELLATVFGTIGKQLMRYSKLVESPRSSKAAWWSWSPSYFYLSVGLLLNLLGGPILEVAAFGQAPQTLLTPLSGLDVMWNVVLVPHTLGEKPSASQFRGCLMLFAGTALTAFSGPHEEPTYTLDVVKDKLATVSAVAYLVVELCLIAAGIAYMTTKDHGHRGRGLVLGCLAGGIGGNLFCMKATASLISATWGKGIAGILAIGQVSPLPFFVAAAAGLIGLSSAYLLTTAMREFEATMMVATYVGAFVTSGCLSGVCVLGELSRVSPPMRVLYTMGVLLVVSGIISAQPGEDTTPLLTSILGDDSPARRLLLSPTLGASRPTPLDISEDDDDATVPLLN